MATPIVKFHFFILHCLVILFFFNQPYLTISQSMVRSLPGFPGPLPFHLETGYVGVGELNQNQLFYYFIESERNPKEDPLMLWLTGGPGCTVWSALAYEIGPLYMEHKEYNGRLPTLVLNPHSWTKVASIIFVDSPVWTGFSYSKDPKNYKGGDTKSSKEVYEFLRKWLNNHPQFLSNPLYIGGDSYSGLIVPIVVQEIANGIDARQEPIFNLKGYLLGNPLTDLPIDTNSVVPFIHGMGIISDELFESFKKSCNGDYYTTPRTLQCEMDIQAIDKPKCPLISPRPKEMMGDRRSLEENSTSFLPPQSLPKFGCRSYGYLLSYYYANDDIVREALHIRKGSIKEWIRCNYSIKQRYTRDITTALPYQLNLSTKGYRSLVYSGDHDMSIPHVGTQAWIKSLNFSIVDDWRSWWVDGQIGGYTRSYANNMTFATIKGGGHTAPEYKPKEALAMYQRWISNKPL